MMRKTDIEITLKAGWGVNGSEIRHALDSTQSRDNSRDSYDKYSDPGYAFNVINQFNTCNTNVIII